MRYWKAVYVESKEQKRAVDQMLKGLRALSSCVDYDTSWEEEEEIDDSITDEDGPIERTDEEREGHLDGLDAMRHGEGRLEE